MSMLSTGISGLNASQTALNVTSKNIANASVDGYSREVTRFKSADVGGVYIADIERVSDEYAVKQAWFNATQYGFATTTASHTVQLEGLMTTESSSLGTSMNSFFKALNAAGSDPMEPAYRSDVLSHAEGLSSRFNTLSGAMDRQAENINSQLGSLTQEANSLLGSLAKTNKAITTGNHGGNIPGALLDERDQNIQKLSEMLDISINLEEDGTATITTPRGEPLLIQSEQNELVLTAGYPDASKVGLGIKSGNDIKRLDEPGGGLGGLQNFRDTQLSESQRELDRLALVMADTMNKQSEAGFDLNGDAGTAMFGDINSDIMKASRSEQIGGTGSIGLQVEISDTSALSADNYQISKNDKGELVVNRSPGGEEVSYETDKDGNISFEGLTISATGADKLGDMANGSTYMIEPGKNAAGGIDVVMTDPDKLAFSDSADEPGSNSNLLDMMALQDKATVGNKSMHQSWNDMVTDVASASARASNDLSASAQLFSDATSAVMSKSGVSLDEEAGNLLMFQQLYSANAKVVSTADEMFQTLLQAV